MHENSAEHKLLAVNWWRAMSSKPHRPEQLASYNNSNALNFKIWSQYSRCKLFLDSRSQFLLTAFRTLFSFHIPPASPRFGLRLGPFGRITIRHNWDLEHLEQKTMYCSSGKELKLMQLIMAITLNMMSVFIWKYIYVSFRLFVFYIILSYCMRWQFLQKWCTFVFKAPDLSWSSLHLVT